MTGWLVVFPLVLIVAAALASFLFVRLSTLRITNDGVEIRNYPQTPKTIPLAEVDRFVPAERVGMFSGLRPATAVLVLTNGTAVPVVPSANPRPATGSKRSTNA